MKNTIYYVLFFLLFCFSCKKTNVLNSTDEKVDLANTIINTKNDFLYNEALELKKESDYNVENSIQKLDVKLSDLSLKIRYITDRAYLSIERNKNEIVSWQPININYYYDMSFEDAEKDLHVLLKNNDTSNGYLLLPAFTEQYSTYFFYYFNENSLNFLGTYEVPEFAKGTFSFDSDLKQLNLVSSGKNLKLKKIQNDEELKFDNLQQDLNLLNGKNVNTNITGIDKYINDNKYFIKSFDINKDGFLDKIVSSKPYEGKNLFVFFGDRKSEYKIVLETVNFSEDGGNQISDIIQTKDGFVIKTKFPDRGDSQSSYYLTHLNNSFYLKKIKDEFYSWQDQNSKICVQNFNFDMKNSIASLFEIIGKTKKDCTKEKTNL